MKYKDIQLKQSALNAPDEWSSLRMPADFVPGLVSVIVPTYNRAMFIAEAIASVLAQAFRPIELLIVDDGSSDSTAAVVRDTLSAAPDDPGFSAVYIQQPNRGASAARNQGLLHSHGEFIQYLDSDDVLTSHKLDNHVSALQSDETLDIVWSAWQVLPSESIASALLQANQSHPSSPSTSFQPTDQIMPWEPWPTLTRRRFLTPHPLWNEHVSRWDDWEFALRQMTRSPNRATSPELCYIQREHGHGRRFDFDFNPAGVEVGLTACRQAALARMKPGTSFPAQNQLIADRFWEVGIEAVSRGTDAQAREAFHSATKVPGTRFPFRIKACISWLGTIVAGRRLTMRILSRRIPT
jgi:hypothetical protein